MADPTRKIVRLKAGPSDTLRTHTIDTSEDAFGETIEAYGDARAEQAAEPLQAQVKRLAATVALFRGKMAAEVMRVEKLAAPKGKDGAPEYDAEAQKTYYLGNEEKHIEPLQAERLCLEFDKAMRTEVKATPATTSEEPGDTPTGDDPYQTALKAAGYEPEQTPAKADA